MEIIKGEPRRQTAARQGSMYLWRAFNGRLAEIEGQVERNILFFNNKMARPKRFELLTLRFVV